LYPSHKYVLQHFLPRYPQTRRELGCEYIFNGGLDGVKELMRQSLELDGPHQCHQYSCSKTSSVKHSYEPSTQNRAQYKSFNDRLGWSREIEDNDHLNKSNLRSHPAFIIVLTLSTNSLNEVKFSKISTWGLMPINSNLSLSDPPKCNKITRSIYMINPL
jgi:hypothetical protein